MNNPETPADKSETEERWLPIPGWELHYAVSDKGRVKRTARGRGCRVPGRILKGAVNSHGYPAVMLSRPGRLQQYRCVHRLMMAAFAGPCPPGWEVNHMDGNKTNNTLANLHYCTNAENHAHAARSGLAAHGARIAGAVLTEEQVTAARATYTDNPHITASSLARKYGVSRTAMRLALTGQNWSRVAAPTVAFRGAQRGETHTSVKLSDADVREIRRLCSGATMNYAQIARKFNISATTVSRIARRKTRIPEEE